MIINVSGTSYCQILMKFQISRPILEKLSKIKCHENIFSSSSSFCSMRADGRTDGRTDRQIYVHDETNSRFSQYCECARKIPIS